MLYILMFYFEKYKYEHMCKVVLAVIYLLVFSVQYGWDETEEEDIYMYFSTCSYEAL